MMAMLKVAAFLFEQLASKRQIHFAQKRRKQNDARCLSCIEEQLLTGSIDNSHAMDRLYLYLVPTMQSKVQSGREQLWPSPARRYCRWHTQCCFSALLSTCFIEPCQLHLRFDHRLL